MCRKMRSESAQGVVQPGLHGADGAIHHLGDLREVEPVQVMEDDDDPVLGSERVDGLEHEAPELYDLLRRALTYLDTGTADKRAMLHFESELCRLLGIRVEKSQSPAMAIGHVCGRLPRERNELLTRLK